jgi:predicted nucleic acid-binding protein
LAPFDFDAALRWARFDTGRRLARRPDSALPFLRAEALAGAALLLDTSVYIDGLQARVPEIVDRALETRTVHHSTVALQELLHAVGVLDPADPRTPGAIAQIGRIVRAIPAHRLSAPDAEILGRAALLAGILCRRQGYGRDQRSRALQDCVLFVQAQKQGFTILTRNTADFDLLLQMLPGGRVLFYRQNSRSTPQGRRARRKSS